MTEGPNEKADFPGGWAVWRLALPGGWSSHLRLGPILIPELQALSSRRSLLSSQGSSPSWASSCGHFGSYGATSGLNRLHVVDSLLEAPSPGPFYWWVASFGTSLEAQQGRGMRT